MFTTLHEPVPVLLTTHTVPSVGPVTEMEGRSGAGRSSKSPTAGARATTLSPHWLCARTKYVTPHVGGVDEQEIPPIVDGSA